MTARLCLVAAVSRNGVIGRDGALPWHLPGELKYFKSITMGKPVIMGRKTFESIGRPLPGRTNIIVTRDAGYRQDGCIVAANLDDAVAAAQSVARKDAVDEIMVAGGATIYAALLPRADRLYLTEVDAVIDGDVYFPAFDRTAWRETWREDHLCGEALPFSYFRLERCIKKPRLVINC